MVRDRQERWASVRRRSVPILFGVGSVALAACGDATTTTTPAASSSSAATVAAPPNGLIVFAGTRANDAGLYLTAADGTGLAHVANTVDKDITPSISRDGKTIVFSDKDAAITVINADGTGRKKITAAGDEATATPGHDSPVVTPDGTKIVFEQDVYPAHTHDLYVVNIDGTNPKKITSLTDTDETAIHPSVSPDGTEIVYEDIVAPDTNRGIFTVKMDGSMRQKVGTLTPGATGDTRPSWAPDGRRVAFTELSSGLHATYVSNLDGTGRQRLSGPAPADDNLPSWSNDSQKLVYQTGKAGIGIINADGTNPHTVAPGDFQSPRWAPGS